MTTPDNDITKRVTLAEDEDCAAVRVHFYADGTVVLAQRGDIIALSSAQLALLQKERP